MQQANVTCIRVYVDVKGLALMQVTFACVCLFCCDVFVRVPAPTAQEHAQTYLQTHTASRHRHLNTKLDGSCEY